MPAWHPNLLSWQPGDLMTNLEAKAGKQRHYNKSSVFQKFGMKGVCGGESEKWKTEIIKEQLLTAGAFGGIKWKGACSWTTKMWGKYFDIFPKPTFDDFYPTQRTLQTFSPSPPPPCSPTTEPPPPCLNILHLFNYLAATLWFGPEPQWKLYLPIRAGLVTGAGQISPSCRCLRERDAFGHITQEEMSLPHCRLVIPSLWSPRGSEDLYVCEGVCVCVGGENHSWGCCW